MAGKKAKSKPQSKRGGRRVGSGRKTKQATRLRAELVAEADKLICDNLPRLVGNLLLLANGGYQRVEEEWTPAPKAKDAKEDEAPGESVLILTKRKVSVAEPDRAANQYLIDRSIGKPTERHEMGAIGGGALRLEILNRALKQVYGDRGSDKGA